ncbi:hypothetical protein [Tenggerimyces flavus]|uniref:Uncharacterized protein n=1 Tax=Tenggerimyces flavus TaxID=1708749 RepID=A0ABV7YL39_9ACTN|nr:hypothetical protein [Tenggerimyces flavus]MBM7790210.1 hypothetical protein [Tenggerimyces flavus]
MTTAGPTDGSVGAATFDPYDACGDAEETPAGPLIKEYLGGVLQLLIRGANPDANPVLRDLPHPIAILDVPFGSASFFVVEAELADGTRRSFNVQVSEVTEKVAEDSNDGEDG